MHSDSVIRRGGVRLLTLLTIVAAIVSCDAPNATAPAPGSDNSGSPLPGDSFYYHWTPGKTIALYVDTTSMPSGFDLRAVSRQAATAWNGVSRFADFQLELTDRLSSADVVVRYRFAPSVVDISGCEPPGSGAGRTLFCTDSSPAPILPLLSTGGGHVKVEVYVDPEGVTDAQLESFGLTRQDYFLALVTHEFGHVVGIGSHSSNQNDVMFGFPRVTRPSENDAAVLRWVWLQKADLLL